MNESDIRAALHRLAAERHGTDAFIRHELGILAGRRHIDLAAIDTLIHGYEIQSDTDSLHRLPEQARDYAKVYRLTLVTTHRHLPRAERILPPWWGIILETISKLQGRL